MQMHIRIFESSQLEGSYVGDLLYKVTKPTRVRVQIRVRAEPAK